MSSQTTTSPDASPSTSPRRRRFRLQISLRALLLLMLLVGVGLTIFRWPWAETSEVAMADPFGSGQPPLILSKTTLRRNWRGQPMAHGPTQRFVGGELTLEEHYYEGELHGPTRNYYQGKVTREQYFGHGQPHGPFRIGDGSNWATQEEFAHGKRHGAAQYVRWRDFGIRFDFDVEFDGARQAVPLSPQLVHGAWQQGKRHGRWTWETGGLVTHTEEFEDDEIVRWDGVPIVEEFWQWLRAQNDPRLLAEVTAANQGDWTSNGDEQLRVFVVDGLEPDVPGKTKPRVAVHATFFPRDLSPAPALRGRLVSGLCEYAARNQFTFAYRYGGLWMLPAEERDKPFVDPTGVSQIEFPAGSPQAAAWNELVQVNSDVGFPEQCLKILLKGTPIKFDCENVSQAGRYTSRQPEPLFTRRRRDVVGQILFQGGCRGELRGNELHITPRPDRTEQQEEAGPLSLF